MRLNERHTAIAKYLNALQQIVKQNTGVRIINPWDKSFTNIERAKIALRMLHEGYKGTYPISDYIPTTPEFVKLIEDRSFLIWIALFDNLPVGISCIEIDDATAFLVCTIKSPFATETKISTGSIMYQRLLDLLSNESFEKIVYLDGEVRMSKKMKIENFTIESSIKSQHVNFMCGLNPFLLCVPKYSMKNTPNSTRQFYMYSRKYLLSADILVDGCLHVPYRVKKAVVAIEDIIFATYKFAFDNHPIIFNYVPCDDQFSPIVYISFQGAPQFAEVYLAGDIEMSMIAKLIKSVFEKVDFIEFITYNSPCNIIIQSTLLALNAIPLGAFPGKYFFFNKDQKQMFTTFHYGILKNNTKIEFVPIELSSEFVNSRIATVTEQLQYEWSIKYSK